MKKILQYIAAFSLLFVGASCEDNENWKIITDIQQGTYITGDALIYSAVATSSSLAATALDGAPEGTNVTGIYTWVEANKDFSILKVDAEGNETTYGKGSVVTSTTPYETFNLDAGASAFTVSTSGLYHIVLNNADNQLTVVPANFGIIGDATPGAWDSETVMTQAFDADQAVVTLTLKDVSLDSKQLKFRYHDWGIDIPYQGSTVKFHSNMGNISDPSAVQPLTAASADCKAGGENFSLDKKGLYDVTLRLDLRTGTFTANAVLTSEDTSSVSLPEKMFINGSPFSADWAWDVAPELTPIHSHDGMFWGIYYFEENAEFKFNSAMAWDGNDFGAASGDAVGYGEYETGSDNFKIATAGYYQVLVIATLSEDKQSVNKKVIFSEPIPYVIGDCAASGWDNQLAEEDKFVLDGDTFVSPVLNAGNLRICVSIEGCDWWQTEFNIFDGNIVYRGTGGDQDAVTAEAGQKAYLNFTDDTGRIE